ncbi:hypothetical protein RI367_002136 [Sorochytrium milnesiophthora]
MSLLTTALRNSALFSQQAASSTAPQPPQQPLDGAVPSAVMARAPSTGDHYVVASSQTAQATPIRIPGLQAKLAANRSGRSSQAASLASSIQGSPDVGSFQSYDEAGAAAQYWMDDNIEDLEAQFEQTLALNGLRVAQMPHDGACLYHAIAHALHMPSSELHAKTMDYLRSHQPFFEPFIAESFAAYVERKSRLFARGAAGAAAVDRATFDRAAFANHIEIVAAACATASIIEILDTHGQSTLVNPADCEAFVAGSETAICNHVMIWLRGGHYEALVPADLASSPPAGSLHSATSDAFLAACDTL